ncbi:unnamed protein product [Aureobasidium vineae]|uniref:Uncharacterized protein n=1 Tax=Aureobasidium vineae TaxID=2773715 RepID=A0A9N8JKG1_9PEZI|nr:unnamed protein product [Aureobasidium vineae]
MAITETIKHAVGLEAGPSTCTFFSTTNLNGTCNHLNPPEAQTPTILQPTLHTRSSIGLLRT